MAMNLEEMIYKRQSCRKFKSESLSDEVFDKIDDFYKNTPHLFEDIKIDYKILNANNIKTMHKWGAPHFIALYSEQKDNYLENIGFVFQQICLFMQSIGIASCWIKMASIRDKNIVDIDPSLKFVILIAIGKADGELYRQSSKADRKKLAEISDFKDEKLKPAQLAPSSINSQPWYFTHDEDYLNVYRKNPNFLKKKFLEPLNKIDMGICLAHMYIANRESFSFEILKNNGLDGYRYLGSIKI